MSITAKIFKSGCSQAVQLPNSLRFDGREVIAKRFAEGVLLPTCDPWQVMREALNEFEPGLVLERSQPALRRSDWTKLGR